jgi:hypothetical protein
MEPSEFSPKWYSHKFHGPGLWYELGLCIRTSELSGLTEVYLAEHGLIFVSPEMQLYIHVLDPGERIISDRGYRDQTFFDIPDVSEDDEQKWKILARQETVNRRIKQFLHESSPFIKFTPSFFSRCNQFNSAHYL